ncbi:undecaprenyl-phosphate glucose phosphotransferase [Botryobacter ruber]|uniref:undecaprenyl-phosphate glucose phosphotransferase n=1 Tax=Botryobacter ruber TaxID=2171629 RepID=UPI000E0B3B6F|nr:undecaprenyl-phosphate glucose phosphotransferase [Botryobacter ruber]
MPRLYIKYIKLVHSVGDIAAVVISSITAFGIVNGTISGFSGSGYLNILLYSLVAWVVCALLLGTYRYYRIARTLQVLLDAVKVVLLYVLLLEAAFNIINVQIFSRTFLILHYIILLGLVLFWRLFVTYTIRYFRKKGYNSRKVIIVGYGDAGQELRRFFNMHPEYAYRFIGFFDDQAVGQPHVVGKVEDIERFVLENEVDEIYCSPYELSKEQVIRLLDFVDKNLVRMKFLPEPGNFEFKKFKIDFYDMIPVLILRSIPLDDAINKMLKRIFDIGFSLFVIVFILSWLLPVLAILIKLDSKGPVFFIQDRMGMDNKVFRCFKLRSMYTHSDNSVKGTARGDARITRIGDFLRKSSLDEFPQFFNVFLGHMSIVGPRPHMLKLNEEYAMIVDKYMVRHFIKPGITGLSQVRGYRGDTSEVYQIRGRVKLDIFYLENWTFLLDLKIIFFTVYNMLRGDDKAF